MLINKRPYRKAKIICTIGPSTCTANIMERLIRAGMDVARLNFSHGDRQFHTKAINLIRATAKKLHKHIAILQDLQGIKIRTMRVQEGGIELRRNMEILLAPGKSICKDGCLHVSYNKLSQDARPGDTILIDDGLIRLRVLNIEGKCVRARVLEGGIVRDRKGINLPGVDISMNSFTPKDRDDLQFGLRHGVDYVAVSFVRSAKDIVKVRRFIISKGKDTPIIAKIEKPEAVSNIDEIIGISDGIMVARGDLGVELGIEVVPIVQKRLIGFANQKGKVVITATQMLESMTTHWTPTRAEAADVANAVIDGTDALMLSAETSTGKYPIEAVATMQGIIGISEQNSIIAHGFSAGRAFSEAVAESAVGAAEDAGARYIVAFTQSGYTARLLSKFKPSIPIFAFTPNERIARRMSLLRGVVPMVIRPIKSTDEVFREVERVLLSRRLAKKGDVIVITASAPIGGSGMTNLLKIHLI